MKLQDIAKQLEKLKYFVADKGFMLNCGVNNENKEDPFSIRDPFMISIKDKKIVLVYPNIQIPVEKTFNSVNELLDFIKENFKVDK